MTAEYSAVLYVRTTPALHDAVLKAAERDGVSVSFFVLSRLAQQLRLPAPSRGVRRNEPHKSGWVIYVRTSPAIRDLAIQKATDEELAVAQWIEAFLAFELGMAPRSPAGAKWVARHSETAAAAERRGRSPQP